MYKRLTIIHCKYVAQCITVYHAPSKMIGGLERCYHFFVPCTCYHESQSIVDLVPPVNLVKLFQNNCAKLSLELNPLRQQHLAKAYSTGNVTIMMPAEQHDIDCWWRADIVAAFVN